MILAAQQAPKPLALTPAIYCTNASHMFPLLGDGLSCCCGRQTLKWVANAEAQHCYKIIEGEPT